MSQNGKNGLVQGGGGMSQKDYLFLLRRCSKLETLETIVARKELTLSSVELCSFYGAADHRRIEIIVGKLFDKIPKQYWYLIK